jgi:saccharopine dehydrogenase (NADP+, L-glutamate forming)
MKTILLLGAGLVARPLVRYLLNQKDINLNIVSKPAERAHALVAGHSRGKVFDLDVQNKTAVSTLIRSSDLVISLLPYTFHVDIAKLCLADEKHLITASYLSHGMIAFDEEAKEKGILLLNEIGLDPGIDHMSAMQIKENIERRGGRVLSFESCCGGLPAPEANDNPFGYKFSWSPRGVLLAGRNSARYRKDGEIIDVPGSELFRHRWPKSVNGLGELQVYPNRDSLIYENMYDLFKSDTFFRGTFRYPGWSETIEKIIDLGFLSEEEDKSLIGISYSQMMAQFIGMKATRAARIDVADFLNLEHDSSIMDRLGWLGLFGDDLISHVRPAPIDILTARMLEKMVYRPGERDMVVLQHDFVADMGVHKEHICSLLLDYGEPGGDSSMARTVSLPTAIAANLIVHDEIDVRGVKIPTNKEIYEPVLAELHHLGISLQETTRTLP